MSGDVLDQDLSRVRVQARQTYVFAQAALLGWEPARARALVARGVESLLQRCRRPDRLFGAVVRLGHGLENDAPELYDNAFCVFALGWAARALGEPRLIAEADATLAALDAGLIHPKDGYWDCRPPRPILRQNPHMHLFEAFLSLHAASGDPEHLARADAIAKLLEARFIDPRRGRLRETFDAWWGYDPEDEQARVEPGHEFEWAWLLCRRAAIGRASPSPASRRLYDAALGAVDADGLVPQSQTIAGAALDPSRRTWQQTEALKAHLAFAELGDAAARARAVETGDRLFALFLDPAPPGGWWDHLDAAGRPIAADMPASTGYHVVSALAECARVLAAPATRPPHRTAPVRAPSAAQ